MKFERGLRRIVSEELTGNNPVPDILGFLYLKQLRAPDLGLKLDRLLRRYKTGDCKPSPLLRMDVPKANFTIRPMARPATEDWLIYEAITDSLSRKVLRNARICRRSFSISHWRGPTVRRTHPWLEFDDNCREVYKKGHKFAVVTDITGYYENISLDELRSRIVDYIGASSTLKKLTDVTVGMLRQWSSERISGYGLPQGPPASSFLADIFLDYVDRKMEKYKGYFRYMDDIRIFCKRKIEAKIALKELTIALRGLKLNINAKKTDILRGKRIEERLFDPKKRILNSVEKAMRSGGREFIEDFVIPALMDLIEDAFLDDAFETRHLNFALYRLSILQNSGFDFDKRKVIENIQNSLVSKPHHTSLFCDFLSMFPKDRSIAEFLISFLKSEDNIYEWQELKVCQCLLRFSFRATQREINFFLKRALNPNRNYAARAFYFLLAGKHGRNRDRHLIVDSYDSLSQVYTKLAVILSVQQLGLPSRNSFYTRVKASEQNEEIGQFIDYVKSLSNPIYFLTTERRKIETYEGVEEPSYAVI